MLPLWKMMPKSRSGFISNKTRQLQRFAEGMKLSSKERYWRWAGFATESNAYKLFSEQSRNNFDKQEFDSFKQELLQTIPGKENINDILLTDFNLVLPNNLFPKDDLISLLHVPQFPPPFLILKLVNFPSLLPYI